jgi:hypothetical protein
LHSITNRYFYSNLTLYQSPSTLYAANMSTQPFRFLHLPAGLRLMVYEEIEITTNKHELKESQFDDDQRHIDPKQDPSITLCRRILPMSILTTCRLIHQEATSILAQKVQQLVEEPVRLSKDWNHADNLIPALRARLTGLSSYTVPATMWTKIGTFTSSVISAINNKNRLHHSTSIPREVEITLSSHNDRLMANEDFFEALREFINLSVQAGLNLTMIHKGYPVPSKASTSGLDYRAPKLAVDTVVNTVNTYDGE